VGEVIDMAEVKTMSESPEISRKIADWPGRVKGYIEEVRAEMRRVTWPSWKQVRATTAVVIVAVFLFAAYFALVDQVLGRGINTIFEAFTKR
jgi:preprotein translocase, SecE subunit, bacterial